MVGAMALIVWMNNGVSFDNRSKAGFNEDFVVEYGKTETVFDYLSQHCPGEVNDFPDMPTRAFVAGDGLVQVLAGNSIPNRRSVGPNLTDMKRDCSYPPIMKSEFNLTVDNSRDYSWVMSPYLVERDASLPVAALVHNEFHGFADPNHREFVDCGIADTTKFLKCWWGSVNLAVSRNGGKTYTQEETPKHIVSSVGFNYSPTNKEHYGAMEPSNIVWRQGFYYALVSVNVPKESSPYVEGKTCVMRTDNLMNAKSWKYWDGKNFTIPAMQASGCTGVMPSGWSLTLTFNDYLDKYVALGCQWQDKPCARFSTDLTHWSSESSTLNLPHWAYGTFIQPGDFTRNFEVTGRSPWFYYVDCENKSNGTCVDVNRNLKRVRVRFSKVGEEQRYDLLTLKFNEMAGIKALDSSFYGNDAVAAKPGFSMDTERRFFRFDGGNWLTIAHSNSLSIQKSFSILIKMKTLMKPAEGQFPAIVHKVDATKRNYGLYLTPGGKLHFSLMKGGSFSGTVSKSSVNDGKWHELLVQFDVDKKVVSYFIDGQLDGRYPELGSLQEGLNSGPVIAGTGGLVADIDEISLLNYLVK